MGGWETHSVRAWQWSQVVDKELYAMRGALGFPPKASQEPGFSCQPPGIELWPPSRGRGGSSFLAVCRRLTKSRDMISTYFYLQYQAASNPG